MSSTPRRILVMLAGFALVFVVLLAFHARSGIEDRVKTHEQLTRQQTVLVRHVVELESSLMETLARDYTVWDELYRFVSTRDKSWADSNLYLGLANYKADAIWVLNSRGESISTVTAPDRDYLNRYRPPASFWYRKGHPAVRHFYEYVDGVLVEFFISGIFRSEDNERVGPSAGTFIVGRKVGGAAFERLSEVLTGEMPDPEGGYGDVAIGLYGPNSLHQESKDAYRTGLIISDLKLHSIRGEAIATLRVALTRTEVAVGSRESERTVWTTVIFGGGLLIILLLALNQLVGRPVRILSTAIEKEDYLALGPLARSRSDFGRLAQALQVLFQQQKDVARAKEAAERATRVKSEFLANMSHEIRTPMHGIVGMGRMLLEEDLPPRARSCADTLVLSAESLIQIVNDILDLSKIEANKLQLSSAEFDPITVIEDVCRLFAPTAFQNRVRILWDADPTTPWAVVGDAGRIRQVLSNLVGNAIKFTAKGYVMVRVRYRTEGVLAFEVRDTGIGIPADRLDAIFDSFTQADGGTSRKFGGSGLGLTISKNLVELMGGGMSVESTEGVGSVFRFWVRPEKVLEKDHELPLSGRVVALVDLDKEEEGALSNALIALGAEPTLDLTPPPDVIILSPDATVPSSTVARIVRLVRFNRVTDRDETRLETPYWRDDIVRAVLAAKRIEVDMRPSGAANNKLVLVAEDNLVNQKLAKWHLERLGFTVRVASNGQECLDLWVRQQFDVILMDVQMPEVSGLDACRFIRQTEEGRRTPIVALTASALDEDRDACLAAGMDAFIAKPFREQELKRVLAELDLLIEAVPAVSAR